MSFNRNSAFLGKSLAWRLFKRHHTHFNDIFWAHKVAKEHAFSCTKGFQRTDSSQVLFNSKILGRRIPTTLGKWADNYSDFDRWSQMASVMAIAGYLETYIAQVTTAALESSPSLVLGGGVLCDGGLLLKTNPKYNLSGHVEPLVRGDWQARMAAYKRFFKDCPFEQHKSDLEKLRKLRNDAGHSFGRDIKFINYNSSRVVKDLKKISDEAIQDYLSLAESVASAIEEHLVGKYIGAYEAIKLFHHWLPFVSHFVKSDYKELSKQFSAHFNEMTLSPYGIARARGLIKYYNALPIQA